MATGERRRGRMRGFWRRVCYGPPRKPLEPHRPLPWLLRAVAWALLALATGGAGAGIVLGTVAEEWRPAASVVIGVASLLFVLGLGTRWMAEVLRPVPLVLLVDDGGG